MTHSTAIAEFPFVAELPKREKTRRMKLLEVLDILEARTKEKGPVIPQSLAAEILGVTRQRVAQFVDSGRIEAFLLNGTRFVYLRSFLEFCKEDRPTGRPTNSKFLAAVKAGKHTGLAIASAMEGDGED